MKCRTTKNEEEGKKRVSVALLRKNVLKILERENFCLKIVTSLPIKTVENFGHSENVLWISINVNHVLI